MYSVESSTSNKPEYLAFLQEFLNTIFKVALMNFKNKNSQFSLDRTFLDLFEKNKNQNFQEFIGLLYELNEELWSIDKYIQNSKKTERDFKKKDINFDILLKSVNICISFFTHNTDDKKLFKTLTELFQNLINKGNVANNKDLKIILNDFNKYIKAHTKYMNMVIGDNKQEKLEEEKVNENLNEQLMKKIQDLGNKLNDQKIKYEIKEKENQKEIKIKEDKIKELEKQNNILNESLINTEICRKLDKSAYDDTNNKISGELNSFKETMRKIEEVHAKEMKTMNENISKMEANHANEMKAMTEKISTMANEMSAMKTNHANELKAMTEKISTMANEMSAMKTNHANEMKNMEKKYEQNVNDLKNKIKSIESENKLTKFKLEITEKKF